MASISLGNHFEQFVQDKISTGRYQNVSEVVRAGLRLLEDYEAVAQDRIDSVKAKFDQAWDDPRPSLPADRVFDRLENMHEETLAVSKKHNA